MLFPQLFDQSVARTPDRTAIIDLETASELTYRELDERAKSVATSLERRGVEPGDRVTICMANRPEHVVLFLATQKAGAVATPFNFRVPADDVLYHLQDSDPEVFVFDDASRDAVTGAAGGMSDGIDVFHVGEETPAFAESFETLYSGPTEEPAVSVGYDDFSVILYSSGTTGDPKGIPLDHEATTSRHLCNSMGQHYYLNETMVGVMPLYHTVGLHGILCGLLAMSGTYICVPQFDPEQVVEGIEEYGVTALHEAPTIFQQLLETDAIEEADLSSVTTIGYSGAPMNEATFERTIDVFDPEHIANLYGTTEAYGTLAYLDLQEIRNPAVTGPANLFFETRVVEIGADDPDAVVDTDVEGELIVNLDSPVAFDGYWQKPDETEAAITDGWFFTGDAARQTEENYVIITGRVDDMIVTGGENVSPVEVEDTLLRHDAVEDAAVVGMPDEEWGELVTAFVVTRDDVRADELDEFCTTSDDLADYKRPRSYEFLDALPRNPSGKVLRYKLRGEDEE